MTVSTLDNNYQWQLHIDRACWSKVIEKEEEVGRLQALRVTCGLQKRILSNIQEEFQIYIQNMSHYV